MNIKIAAITDDGQTISQHFGRAAYYAVLTIEDGKIIAREQREKMGTPISQANIMKKKKPIRADTALPPPNRIVTSAWPKPSAIAKFCWCAA